MINNQMFRETNEPVEMPVADKQLYFIIGIGRSGTTLLTRLLNEYSDLHCMPEANFLVFFLHNFRSRSSFSKKDIDMLFEEIEIYSRSHPIVGWTFNAAGARTQIDRYLAHAANQKFEIIFKIIYSNFGVDGINKESARIMLDKNPVNTLFADQISASMPEAKFIYITRDYRANVLSRKQNAFLKSGDVAFNAFRWRLFNTNALRFQGGSGNKVHHLRYEDLVQNTKDEITKLLLFLNITESYREPGSGNQYSNVSKEPKQVQGQHKQYFQKKYTDLAKPVNTSRLLAWQNELKSDEIILCDRICAHFARRYGYEPVKPVTVAAACVTHLTHFPAYVKALWSVYKEHIVYYVNPEIKMRRLKTVYKKLGFEKK